ncbi:MAG: sensor histidine kinase [Rickettsiaceae bacterium]|nr:sensor histidine kinase [Rickettsiaceae bacterium]
MSKNLPNYSSNLLDQKVNIQMIVFITVVITLILAFVFFIHIYSQKREVILEHLEVESVHLELLIIDNLNYSNNLVDIASNQIANNPTDLNYIYNILKAYVASEETMFDFGWRKFSWVDKDLSEVVTSHKGIMHNPNKLNFIKEAKNLNKEKFISYQYKSPPSNSSFKIIRNVLSDGQYQGSLVLSYDIPTLVRSLNIKKKHKSTNFVILNNNLEIIAQSNSFIDNLLDHDAQFVQKLESELANLHNSFIDGKHSTLSYVDMLDGLNYHITDIKNFPFILVVNIDNNKIREDILNEMFRRFIIVFICAILSLSIIIFIYKRETTLRARSEKATLIATHATEAKTNFLAFTAHEIRSPLGFIITGSEIMLKELMGEIPNNYQEYVRGINQKAKEILNFITDILDENQILAGKFRIKNELHKICEIIKEAKANSLANFVHRKINITTELSPQLPLLLCDKGRMIQILNNLISNSIKYSEDNTNIELKAIVKDSELILSVRDQGYGIDEDKIPLILSPYGTAHETNKFYSNNSYGLGLSIVTMLVEAHNAELRISSIKGKGTTVKIIFPKYKLVYDSHQK